MNTESNDGANHGLDKSGNKKGARKKAKTSRGLVINTTRQVVARAPHTHELLTPGTAIKNSPNEDEKAESNAKWEDESLRKRLKHLEAVLEIEDQERKEAERKLREIRTQQNRGGGHGDKGGEGNASRC